MTNKPSPGALDFARRHGLPEPRTRQEAVEMMRGILEPLGSASWRDSWRRYCGRRVDGSHYTGSTTTDEKVGYDSGDDSGDDNNEENSND